MKKTLFVKFLFLLLCGSVLTTAGCKDYDDDIDALRNDVEDLKGAVVELNGFENRIAALERTQAAFEAIDFSGFAKKSDISSLQTQIEGCVKDSDLAAKIVAAIESSLADGALQGEPEQSEIGYSGRNSGYLRYPGNTGERSGNAGKYD